MSTFLEFNRDLFLCNTIYDPQDIDNSVPVYDANGQNLYKRTQGINPNENIYVINKTSNFYTSVQYDKNQSHKSGYLCTEYTKGFLPFVNDISFILIRTNPLSIDATINDMYYQFGKTWMDSSINYDKYISNLDDYLANYDVWVGSGTINMSSTLNNDNNMTYVFYLDRGSLTMITPGWMGSCNDYSLNTTCPTDDPKTQASCEICKNFKYRDWYDANNPIQIDLNARMDDATSEYYHMWLQTWNLGIGILLLSYGIYYQLS